jgi:hypothetical protein
MTGRKTNQEHVIFHRAKDRKRNRNHVILGIIVFVWVKALYLCFLSSVEFFRVGALRKSRRLLFLSLSKKLNGSPADRLLAASW